MRDDHDSLTCDLFADTTHQAHHTGLQGAAQVQDEQTHINTADAPTAQTSANGDELHQRAQQHAQEVAKSFRGYNLIALHTHRLADGSVSHWVMRLKNSAGKKTILPFAPLTHFTPERMDEIRAEQAEKQAKNPRANPIIYANGFVQREPCYQLVYPAGNGSKPLYALDRISTAPADQPVWFLEGQQKADAVNDMGGYATTGGGATSISNLDLSPLADRHVIIWPDHDDAGRKMADELALLLLNMGCTVEVIDPSKITLSGGAA